MQRPAAVPIHPLLLRKKGKPMWEWAARLPIDLIELPFRVTGYGIKKGTNVIEAHHVVARVQQVPPWLLRHHILVENGSQGDGSGFGVAVGLQGAVGQDRPIEIDLSSALTYRTYQTYALHARLPKRIGPRGDVRGWVQYRIRPQDNFFGLGDTTSVQDQTQFRQSSLNTGLALSYRPGRLQVSGLMDWTDFEIDHGAGRIYPSTISRFPGLPGLNGARLFGVGVALAYPDTLYTGKPGLERGIEVSAHTYWDVDGVRYGFNRYTLTLYQAIPVLWDDRVLTFRLMGWMTDPRGQKQIPFFALHHLGGSTNLRGYPDLRFWERNAVLFNAEYWYPLWDIGWSGGALDAVWFVDTGMVFHRFNDLSFRNLVTDYGGGLRFRSNQGVQVRLSVAHSPETTRISARVGSDF